MRWIFFVLITLVLFSGCAQKETKISNLLEAVAMNVPMKCTVADASGAGDLTMYIKGQKVSVSVIDKENNEAIKSLNDGTYMYMWSENKGVGVKMNIEGMKKLSPDSSDVQRFNQVDISKISQYAQEVKCIPAILTDSDFTAPSGIQFQDITEMLSQTPQYQQIAAPDDMMNPTNPPQNACELCGTVPPGKEHDACVSELC